MSVKVNETIALLSDAVVAFSKINPYNFLGAGCLANSLFFYKASKHFNDEHYLELSWQEFEKVYNEVEHADLQENLSLIGGFAGVGWVYQYLVNQEEVEYDADFFSFFDKIIIDYCANEQKINNYDLFYGILGYGSYFLQRSKYDKVAADPYLNKLVAIFETMSINQQSGTVWFCDMFSDVKGKINLGMAHGLPSIISFLAKVYDINKNADAKSMAENCVNWLLTFKNPDPEAITLFPYFGNFNEKHSEIYPIEDENSETTRLAWCYGDLGIGYSIFLCGIKTDNERFIAEGIQILKKCAERKIE
ncbi:lanthionine synthetase LanC family protein [Flavobacterium sp. 3HN19-14]|uniref:lanthionine synthetase LanC family protein n=1 Tax=Flavobacterium sp. 3HN19-14 TaxID=3448133 RepID=UPI003EE05C84